jgi:hypothetical protein
MTVDQFRQASDLLKIIIFDTAQTEEIVEKESGEMSYVLTQIGKMPLWESGLIVVILPNLLSILFSLLTRKYFGFKSLWENNSILSIQFNASSLLYALLLTFATISVWDKFSSAQSAVIEEAASARAIYFLLAGENHEEVAVKDSIKNYINNVLHVGWPQLAEGQDSQIVRDSLENLYTSARRLALSATKSAQLSQQIFTHIDIINKARQVRISVCRGIVPPALWILLLVGALIMSFYFIFLGGPNILLQSMLSGVTIIMLQITLLLIINFDHPFGGEISVSTYPYILALEDMRNI